MGRSARSCGERKTGDCAGSPRPAHEKTGGRRASRAFCIRPVEPRRSMGRSVEPRSMGSRAFRSLAGQTVGVPDPYGRSAAAPPRQPWGRGGLPPWGRARFWPPPGRTGRPAEIWGPVHRETVLPVGPGPCAARGNPPMSRRHGLRPPIFEPARLPRALPGGPEAARLRGHPPPPRRRRGARAFGILARERLGNLGRIDTDNERGHAASAAFRERGAPGALVPRGTPAPHRRRRAGIVGTVAIASAMGSGSRGKALPAVPAAPPVPASQSGMCGVLVVAPFGLRTFERCSVATAGVGAVGLRA
jgi:hypothetical protein